MYCDDSTTIILNTIVNAHHLILQLIIGHVRDSKCLEKLRKECSKIVFQALVKGTAGH